MRQTPRGVDRYLYLLRSMSVHDFDSLSSFNGTYFHIVSNFKLDIFISKVKTLIFTKMGTRTNGTMTDSSPPSVQIHCHCNFKKYIMQIRGCIYFGNMYNNLRKVMGVVPGRSLLVGYLSLCKTITLQVVIARGWSTWDVLTTGIFCCISFLLFNS